jgi:hypothetical protein
LLLSFISVVLFLLAWGASPAGRSSLRQTSDDNNTTTDLIDVAVSSPPSPILRWGNQTQIKYYFLVVEQYEANKSHHTPLEWLPVRTCSYAFPGARTKVDSVDSTKKRDN